MSTLFIIGNGFDVAHDLKTSYWYFMEYVKQYAGEFYHKFENTYGYAPYNPDGCHSEKDEQLFLKRRDQWVFEGLWKNIEYNLGFAEEQDMLDYSSSIVESMDLESGPIGIEDTLNEYWENEYKFIEEVNQWILRWARQIRLSKVKPKSDRLIMNTKDYFLTFNYTSTLERIYHIPNERILHIHGGLSPYCELPPVLGHGNKKIIEHYKEEARHADEQFDEGYKSICNAIARFYERTLKDTDLYKTFLASFLNNCEAIDTIEIIGHSLSDVDLPYFQLVYDLMGEDVNWIVYYHNENERKQFLNTIIGLGVDESHLDVRPSNEFWA